MQYFISTALAALGLSLCIDAFAACNAKPALLLGSWENTRQAGFFGQMEFTIEDGLGVFNSWRHERPEISGATWTLEKCVLKISTPADSSLSFEYTASMMRAANGWNYALQVNRLQRTVE